VVYAWEYFSAAIHNENNLKTQVASGIFFEIPDGRWQFTEIRKFARFSVIKRTLHEAKPSYGIVVERSVFIVQPNTTSS
jgi:hypothetical protein